jgi:gliding motility-associated protein GldE
MLVIIVILLVCSALISGSEVAFFSLTPAGKELLQNGDQKNNLVLQLLEKPRRLLATILVVNNFVNIGIVILSTYVVNAIIDFQASKALEFVIQVVLITFVLLLFGEVIPKVYATRNGTSLSRFMALPLIFLSKVFYPIIYLLMNSSAFIERNVKWKGENLSSDDLHKALELTSDEDIKGEDQKILEGIVKFGNTDVKQIMVSRVDVVALDQNSKFDEVLKLIHKHRYSRIPVYDGGFDNIKGTLYIKDILPFLSENTSFHWMDLIKKPFFVPENKKIDDLLKEFQEKKIHLAIVVDEYGGASGIVTLDDVLGEVVGDISEELQEEDTFIKLDENNYVFDGKTPLVDFYRVLNVNEEDFENAKGESDTLAGFIIEISGRIPKKLEKFEFGNCQFTVESANVKRIKEIKVTIVHGKKE